MAVDCTTTYLPNGKAQQRTPLNKAALQKHGVEMWARFSAPMYDSELMLKDYHLIRDKGTSDYYVRPNKLGSTLCQKKNNRNFYSRMRPRKPIDSFVKAHDSRFDMIQKSPACSTNVMRVTGLSFKGYN